MREESNIPDSVYMLYVFLAHIEYNGTEISKEKHLFSLELGAFIPLVAYIEKPCTCHIKSLNNEK
jgi:hypothetical protein